MIPSKRQSAKLQLGIVSNIHAAEEPVGATVDRICQLSIRFLSQQQQQQSLMFTFGSTDASSAELFHVDQVLQRLTELRILAHGVDDDDDDGDDDDDDDGDDDDENKRTSSISVFHNTFFPQFMFDSYLNITGAD